MNQSDSYLPIERLLRWERERGGEIWLTQPLAEGRVLDFTWAQGMDQVRRMTRYLQSFGWERGSRVAILSKNCAWWYFAEFAAWMAGYVSVPIYPSLVGDSVRYILEHSGAKALFLGKLDSEDWGSMQKGIPSGIQVVRLPTFAGGELPGVNCADWDTIIGKTAPLSKRPARGADDLATVMYTSGTTGTPKGVMHSFGNYGNVMKVLIDAYGVGPQDRMLSYLPTAHLADKISAQLMAVASGCRIYFNESLETFAADLKRARPTVFASVPRLWTKFRQAVNAKLPQQRLALLLKIPGLNKLVRRKVLTQLGLDATRFAISGAAPLPADLHQWYLDLGLDLCEGYGMTENFGVCYTTRPGYGRVGTVGRRQDGVEVKFSDAGEILMKGPTVMMGYFKEPEKTRETFTQDGWLRTGDLGQEDAEGYLRITGRAKEQFKTSKGKYVAPAPIENRLGAHDKIEASCVTGVGFPQPFALVMLPPGESDRLAGEGAKQVLAASLDQLRLKVNETLDPHERLDFLVVVPEQWTIDNGFITPTFKVKRPVVEKHYASQFERWAGLKQTVVWG
jgi:long-chain acyl-CoA synthetase